MIITDEDIYGQKPNWTITTTMAANNHSTPTGAFKKDNDKLRLILSGTFGTLGFMVFCWYATFIAKIIYSVSAFIWGLW